MFGAGATVGPDHPLVGAQLSRNGVQVFPELAADLSVESSNELRRRRWRRPVAGHPGENAVHGVEDVADLALLLGLARRQGCAGRDLLHLLTGQRVALDGGGRLGALDQRHLQQLRPPGSGAERPLAYRPDDGVALAELVVDVGTDLPVATEPDVRVPIPQRRGDRYHDKQIYLFVLLTVKTSRRRRRTEEVQTRTRACPPNRHRRRPQTKPPQVPQYARPTLLALPIPVLQRHQLLRAVRPHPNHHQRAPTVLFKPDVEVNPVDQT